MESTLTQITNYLITQSWQIALLAIVVAFLSFLLKNKSAHVRYLLWMIVLAKCLVPPFYNIQLAVLPEQEQIKSSPSEAIDENMTYHYSLPEVIVSEVPLPISTISESVTPKVESQPVVAENKVRYNTRAFLAIIWLAGIAVFAFYFLFNAFRTELWLLKNRKELPEQYKKDIENLFKDYGVTKIPKLWMLDKINQPFVWGLVRGSIYLPTEMTKEKQMKFQISIIGHELSHVIRLDALVNSLQIITQTAFWFHPFAWWTNRKIRTEREKCCDEMTIARLNALPEDYSNAIVELLAAKYERARRIPSLAVAGKVKNIEERIKIMLTPGKKFYKWPGIIAAISVLLIAVITVPTAFVLTSCTNRNIASDNVQEELLKTLNIPFQLDSPITISLGENNFTNPKVFNNPTMKFYKENDKLFADFDITYSSYPKTTWQVILDLLDSYGETIKNIQAQLENSGTIISKAILEKQQVKIDCGKWDDIKNTEAFKFNLESIRSTYNSVIKYNEEIPLSLELEGLDSSSNISLYQAEFTKINDSQTISLKINPAISSWPKSQWEITCALFDKNGNLFGKTGKTIENSGIIIGIPEIRIEDISMLIVSNTDVKFSDVERYEITFEKIIDNAYHDLETVTNEPRPVIRTVNEPNITFTTQVDLNKIDDIIKTNQVWLLPSLEKRRGLIYQYRQEEPYLETIMFDENGNIMSQLQSCKESPNEPTKQLFYQADGTYIRTKYIDTFVRPQIIDIDEQNREMSLIKKDRMVKNLATGLNLDCALTKLARNPEIFLAKIETLDNDTYKLTLNTTSRDAKIFTGTMLTFTSWAYMHDVLYSKSEIIFDAKTNMPLSEKDYSGSTLVASYTFSDYLDSPGGMAPGKINALIPNQKDEQDNSLEMEAVFDFIRSDVWLLQTCHSEFKNGVSSSTGTVNVLPVTGESFEPIEQLLDRIENTEQIFSNLNNAKEGKVVATMLRDKPVPVFARAIWKEEAKGYISDLKDATGYDKPLIGVIEANCQNLDNGTIKFSFTLFSNLYWKEFLTIVSYEIFNTSGKSFRADLPVKIRTEESPREIVTTLEIPYPSDYSFDVDKIAITPKVEKMTTTYHGHGAWITIIDLKVPEL
ncbi:MAG: M56 family metallopeptidase [Sedimentisphaerales bacterium]|nr:M56 family metallopeptidase [Sedimentisphaerales bacterium]